MLSASSLTANSCLVFRNKVYYKRALDVAVKFSHLPARICPFDIAPHQPYAFILAKLFRYATLYT